MPVNRFPTKLEMADILGFMQSARLGISKEVVSDGLWLLGTLNNVYGDSLRLTDIFDHLKLSQGFEEVLLVENRDKREEFLGELYLVACDCCPDMRNSWKHTESVVVLGHIQTHGSSVEVGEIPASPVAPTGRDDPKQMDLVTVISLASMIFKLINAFKNRR